mmetsp:Transcript_22726/g.44135  ORF Transcript_22726/g.44135 Transcript_22726/m.44135 type:complete len:207 (+) Transcript_22726:152-772(+)
MKHHTSTPSSFYKFNSDLMIAAFQVCTACFLDHAMPPIVCDYAGIVDPQPGTIVRCEEELILSCFLDRDRAREADGKAVPQREAVPSAASRREVDPWNKSCCCRCWILVITWISKLHAGKIPHLCFQTLLLFDWCIEIRKFAMPGIEECTRRTYRAQTSRLCMCVVCQSDPLFEAICATIKLKERRVQTRFDVRLQNYDTWFHEAP